MHDITDYKNYLDLSTNSYDVNDVYKNSERSVRAEKLDFESIVSKGVYKNNNIHTFYFKTRFFFTKWFFGNSDFCNSIKGKEIEFGVVGQVKSADTFGLFIRFVRQSDPSKDIIYDDINYGTWHSQYVDGSSLDVDGVTRSIKIQIPEDVVMVEVGIADHGAISGNTSQMSLQYLYLTDGTLEPLAKKRFVGESSLKTVLGQVKSLFDSKVDKVSGKGLSTNDFTAALKTKLDGIAEGANKTTVDTAMSSSSTNPVQNKVVNTALGNKVDKVNGKGLSTKDFTANQETKLNAIGTIKNATALSANKSVANETGTDIISVSLPAGTWLLRGIVRWASKSGGERRVNISATKASSGYGRNIPVASSGTTIMEIVEIVNPTSETTYYLNAYQNSGAAVNVASSTTALRAVRIG